LPKALVTFASLTGNDEEIANIMTNSLVNLGIDARMVECQSVYATDFIEEDICVVVTYTYGAAADLPEHEPAPAGAAPAHAVDRGWCRVGPRLTAIVLSREASP